MTYRLVISRQVQRDIDRLPGHVRQRVRRTIATLTLDPRPAQAKELGGELAGVWRIRLDTYRILYTVDDHRIVVEVVRVVRRSPTTYTV